MNTRRMNPGARAVAGLAIAWIACAGALFAQTDMHGHWSGTLNTPVGAMGMEVDLDRSASGWIGSVSIPAQGATGIPLERISFANGKGVFHLKAGAGDPSFSGTLSADGKALDGNFSQGAQSFPLKLTRTGEAKVELPKASPPVAATFVGKWEGTIQASSGLHLVLTISNGASGAEARMVSVDQGNAQIPVTSVAQNGTKLSLKVNAVGGGYEGEINEAGTELNGNWSQMGNSIPLQFKKSAK
jgi:hypothetical protein